MGNLKKSSLVILSLTVVILSCINSCKVRSISNLSGIYIVKLNEVKNLNNQTILTVTDFHDSRCPINTQCIWAGFASAAIKLKNNEHEQTISLCIGKCLDTAKSDTQRVILNGIVYHIQLKEINPLPGSPNPAPQKATIIITKP